MRGLAIKVPGLRRRTGCWAVCHGVFSPNILIDTCCPVTAGYNALLAHETYHAKKFHKLKELVVLFFCWTLILIPVWMAFKRRIERTADAFAFRLFGPAEFRAFLWLHKHPSSWWGRYKYGATIEARYRRCRREVVVCRARKLRRLRLRSRLARVFRFAWSPRTTA